MIRVKNVTPEIDLLKEDIENEEFKNYYNEIKNKYNDKCVFVSVDNLKFLPSIKNKLEGYKKFLSDFSENEENLKKNVYLIYIRYSTVLIIIINN